MPDFVDFEIETQASVLADRAVAALQVRWPGWVPNDGDMEVIQAEALALIGSAAADNAARVPAAILRAYGTKLKGVVYSEGAPALATSDWVLVDDLGHVIPAGTEIDVDGFAFRTIVDVTVPALSTTAVGVTIEATLNGADANGLQGTAITPITSLDWLEDVTLTGLTAGGVDPEDDDAYQERLARELQLEGTTVVTRRDFQIMALSQTGIGRAVAENNGTRAVVVTVTDALGEPVSTAIKNALIAKYADYRLVNTVVTVSDPTYTTITVTYTAKSYPGFDPVDLRTRINARLAEYLSPAAWGEPTNFGDPGTSSWFNETVVRLNKLIDLIGDVEGVNYVETISVSGNAGATLAGVGWTLAGTYPLTRSGVHVGTIT